MLALFDFLVFATAVFALFSARRINVLNYLAQFGYATIALAALVGTIRYLGFPTLSGVHHFTSTGAAILGVPCVAVGFLVRTQQEQIRVVAALFIVGMGLWFWSSAAYALIIGVTAQLLWLIGGWIYRKAHKALLPRVVLAIALTSVAGLLFATPGVWLGLRHENIFHGLLALALMQQAQAFSVR